MNAPEIDQLKQFTANHRLSVGATLAVAVHLILALAGNWQLSWLTLPANHERLLVMTLQPTSEDGVRQADTVADTVNEADRRRKTDAALQNAPAPPPAATTYIDSIDSLMPEKAAPRPAEPVTSVTAPEIQPAAQQESNDQRAPYESTAANLQNESSPDALAVIAQAQSELASPLAPAADISEPVEVMPVSEQQKNMLQQQIQQWSTHIETADTPSKQIHWEHKGQEYTALFKRIPAGGEMDLENVLVEVITDQDGVQLSTQLRLKKLAFSNFAQFVHRWDRDLQLHDDIVDGRFHSNSKIHLEVGPKARPVFHGRVTTASHSVDINRSGRFISNENVFLDGLETGIRKIDMPISNLLYADTPQTGEVTTHVFDQDTRIKFTADGQFFWHYVKGDRVLHAQPIGDRPIRILAAKGVSLYVSGQVAGKVLVFSPKRIVIEGNLVYAGHAGSSNGDSFLGLVSARNIDIARNRITGKGDLNIDGAIYAQKKFVVRGRTANNNGTLHIFGSLSAGSLTPTEPRYATKIVFDPRMEESRPPGFPVTDRFELAMSGEYWMAPPGAD